MNDERRGRGQKVRPEGLDRFISLLSKSKVGKARCKDRRFGGGQGGGGGQGRGDGRQGWQGRHAGSSSSIHGACRCSAVQGGFWYRLGWFASLVLPGLGRVTGVTGATGSLFTFGWRSCLEYLLGRYDDPGPGFWALGLLLLGLGLGLPWFVLGWLHAVCSGCNTTQNFDTGLDRYSTVC